MLVIQQRTHNMHILARKAQRLGTFFGVKLPIRKGSGNRANCEGQLRAYGVDDIVIVLSRRGKCSSVSHR